MPRESVQPRNECAVVAAGLLQVSGTRKFTDGRESGTLSRQREELNYWNTCAVPPYTNGYMRGVGFTASLSGIHVLLCHWIFRPGEYPPAHMHAGVSFHFPHRQFPAAN